MIDTRLLMGFPLPFGRVCDVYPPTLNDVLGNKNFSLYSRILTMSQEDIWDDLAEKEGEIPEGSPTPFSRLMEGARDSEKLKNRIEEAFEFFCKEPVQVRTDGEIIIFTDGIEEIKTIEQIRVITEENYFSFQNLIREVTGKEQLEAPVEDEHPRVALIKAKARARDRLIEKKGNQSSISLSEMLVALSCMDVGFTLLKEHGEISYLAVLELFKAGQRKERYQNDMLLISGGADAKKIRPKDWIRNTN